MIAALYVDPRGAYAGLPGVELWDQERDARTYPGPHPVVAHPPCERWGRYWHGGPSAKVRRVLGDDGGCFAYALDAVRRFGGVLEHPEGTYAWKVHGLNLPPRVGGWIAADWDGGWTCCVEQGHYGHRARKATWLYAQGVELPSLAWGRSEASARLDDGYHRRQERIAAKARGRDSGARERLSKAECSATPREFRDVLLRMVGYSFPSPVEDPPVRSASRRAGGVL